MTEIIIIYQIDPENDPCSLTLRYHFIFLFEKVHFYIHTAKNFIKTFLKSAWVEKDRGQDRGKEDVDLDPALDHVIESETDLAIVKEDDLAIEIVQVAEKDLLKESLISKKRSKLKKSSTKDKLKRENGVITFSGAIETSKMRFLKGLKRTVFDKL